MGMGMGMEELGLKVREGQKREVGNEIPETKCYLDQRNQELNSAGISFVKEKRDLKENIKFLISVLLYNL